MPDVTRSLPTRRPPVPNPVLARRALSEVRSFVRHGLGLVRGGIDQVPLPPPVAALKGSVLRKVDNFAQQADAVARTAVDGLLGPAPRASGMVATLERTVELADTPGLRVSGTAAREALSDLGAIPDPETAGAAMRRLVEAGALRPSGRVASATIFAAILSRLQPGDGAVTIPTCLAIAEALSEEIETIAGDEAALSRLFAEFRDHV